MGIWDRSEALSYPRLTDTFERDQPFTLLGMRNTAPITIPGNDLGETPVTVLTVRGAVQGRGADPDAWSAYGDVVELGIISGPIQDMASEATDEDFPVVVKWTKVQPKDRNRSEGTVLALVAKDVAL